MGYVVPGLVAVVIALAVSVIIAVGVGTAIAVGRRSVLRDQLRQQESRHTEALHGLWEQIDGLKIQRDELLAELRAYRTTRTDVIPMREWRRAR